MEPASKDKLVDLLRTTAAENSDRPLGERVFFRETGVTKRQLWDSGIRSYGDLCRLAGYEPNPLKTRLRPDQLFEPLALLTVQLGRFPGYTDRAMARRQDPKFPGSEAYRTAESRGGPLPEQLLAWCRSRPEQAGALTILEELASARLATARPFRERKVVNGYVYLMRYGKSGRDYKIGRSENPPRRHAQIANLIPGNLNIVHVIETDDPVGIEAYWLRRFEKKRLTGKREIFRLTTDDVAAFRIRKYQ